jgi:pyruvate dehydrogenase E1 component alpha subunit
MPRAQLESFTVEYLQILNESGQVDKTLEPPLPPDDLRRLYRTMLLARLVDDRMYKLQAQGRMGTFPGVRGQEACVGVTYALQANDWLQPAFRETACLFWRGIPVRRVLQYFAGMEEGNLFPPQARTLPIPICVGSQTLHATGVAWADFIRGHKNVTLCYFGDGGTSEGDFHEALNLAGVYKLPVVYVCMNNQWAISVPRSIQSASKTLAQKAIAYGFSGVQIDGNDLLAAVVAGREAMDKARAGKGPTLIEMVTYRLGPHTTADDAKRYRKEEEVQQWLPKDPLVRMRKYLEAKHLWSPQWQAELEAEFAELIEQEVQAYERDLAALDPLAPFDHIYAAPTPELQAQRQQAAAFLGQAHAH